MGVSVYYNCGNGEESFTLAGQNEIEEVWLPLIQSRQFACLEQCVTGGLSVDADIYPELLEEVAAVKNELESRIPYVNDPGNVIFRCQLLYHFLTEHPPNQTVTVYIG